jgi:lipopolysaccharide/colanic/teichoic acid biosynthesis glycosyltransferase
MRTETHITGIYRSCGHLQDAAHEAATVVRLPIAIIIKMLKNFAQPGIFSRFRAKTRCGRGIDIFTVCAKFRLSMQTKCHTNKSNTSAMSCSITADYKNGYVII